MATRGQVLSEKQGFLAMTYFLAKYHQQTGRKAELAVLLSGIQMLADGRPGDPAAWEDWLEAVRMVLEDATQ